MPNIENMTNIKRGDLVGQVRGDNDRVDATSAPTAGKGNLIIVKEHSEWTPSIISKLPDKSTFPGVIIKITHKNNVIMRKGREGMQDFVIKALWFTCRGINRMKFNPPAIDEDLDGTMASNSFPLLKSLKIVMPNRKMVLNKKTNPRHKLINLDHFAGALELRECTVKELIAILFCFVSEACCCITGYSQFLKREYIQIKRNRLRQVRLESINIPGA